MSFDCVAADIKLLGNHLLEASAGTGKTFAIEHIYTRLILEEKFSVEDILVITFTKAATRELKRRILRTLNSTISLLSEPHAENLLPYLNKIVDKEEAIWTIERAKMRFDEAEIYTIHGFCFKTLKENALNIGVDVTGSDPDSHDYQAVIFKEVIDVLRKEVDKAHFSRAQITALLKKYGGDFYKICRDLARLISQQATFSLLPSYEESVAAFTEAKAFFTEDILSQYGASFRKLMNREGEIHSHFLSQAKNMELEELIEAEENFLEYLSPEYVKKRNVFLDGFPWEEVKKLREITLQAANPYVALLRIAARCAEHLSKVKEQQDLFLPDDLLSKMHDHLDGLELSYRAVIVDEFQDTDALQWEIIETLFVKKKKVEALYLVGDPKQSIYAFRNADLGTYFAASKALGREATSYLETNYRSHPDLIHALNTLFSQERMGKWLAGEYPLHFSPSKVSPKQDIPQIDDEKGAVHFFHLQGKKTREKTFPPVSSEEEYFFPFIAKEIIKLHQKGASFKSFAILIKDRFQADRLQRYLRSKGIPSIAKGVMSLVETEAFAFFETLFTSFLQKRDLSLIKQVLSYSFIGFTASELQSIEDWEEILTQFGLMQQLLRERGFSQFWGAFLRQSFDGVALLDSLLSLGLETYSDLQQIALLLMEKEARERQTIEDFLFFLNELRKDSKENDEALKRQMLTEGEQVTIMSTHMSKGLEFDVVFAFGILSRMTTARNILKVQGKHLLFDEEDEQCKRALHLQDQEKLRLLYVALTRARSRVYVPHYLSEESASLGLCSPIELFLQNQKDILSFLQALSKEASITYDHLNGMDLTVAPLEKKPNPLADKPIGFERTFCKVFSHSFSSLAKKGHFSASDGPPESHSYHSLPMGSETGTIIHGIFEQIIKEALYFPWDETAIRHVLSRQVGGSLLSEYEATLYPLIHATFHSEMAGSVILSKIPPAQMLSEVEFHFYLGKNALFKGFADLIFLWKDKYYLLDWKTNYLGPNDAFYGKMQMENVMRENEYYLQGALYASALQKYVRIENFESHFGGMYYLFLRGAKSESKGIYHFYPKPLNEAEFEKCIKTK